MKKILFLTIIFIMSCSTSVTEDQAKTEAKEIGESIVEVSSKIDDKPFVSLQQIGFESILPDIVYQNFLVLREFDFVKEKSEKKDIK